MQRGNSTAWERGIQMSASNGVYFRPWVGSRYRSDGYQGLRILVLGVSHYDQGYGKGPGTTSYVVEQYISGRHERKYFDGVGRIFEGTTYGRNEDERRRFWESVAFCNLIQEFVGTSPDSKPTSAHFSAAMEPFRAVARELSPDFVLVTGFTLWDKVTKALNATRPEILQAREIREYRRCELRVLPGIGDGRLYAGYILHPSRGFRVHDWSQWAAEYVESVKARLNRP